MFLLRRDLSCTILVTDMQNVPLFTQTNFQTKIFTPEKRKFTNFFFFTFYCHLPKSTHTLDLNTPKYVKLPQIFFYTNAVYVVCYILLDSQPNWPFPATPNIQCP